MNYLHKQWDFYVSLALCQELIPGRVNSLLLLGSKQLQYLYFLHIKLSVTNTAMGKILWFRESRFFVNKPT